MKNQSTNVVFLSKLPKRKKKKLFGENFFNGGPETDLHFKYSKAPVAGT